MRLTTKGRYAVTAILDLALHSTERPVTLADVAGRQGISLSYLEQLFARLRRFSLVSSVRGPGGGYLLGRGAAEISIAEVITAVDESLDARRCNGEGNCKEGRPCLTHGLWEDLSGRIYEHLQGISVEDLMNRQSVRKVAQRQDGDKDAVTASCMVRRTFRNSGERPIQDVPLE